MATRSTARERMLDAGEALLSERGYSSVTMLEVIERASAPRGSIYHHFPGGKEDLALEVARRIGRDTVALVDHVAARTGGPEEFLRGLVDRHERRTAGSDYGLGCPLVGMMVNASAGPDSLRAASAESFTAWIGAVAQHLAAKGVPPATGRRVASAFVAAVEGAIVISRTTRSTAAFTTLRDSVPGLLTTPA